MEDLGAESRLVIYPSIQAVLLGDDIRALLKLYRAVPKTKRRKRWTAEKPKKKWRKIMMRIQQIAVKTTERRIRLENQKTTEEKPCCAVSICLNNWHYIDKKCVISDGINFFYGPFRSGKSTVIDALRWCSTPTRTAGHFSTRRWRMIPTEALTEYLRGMVHRR